MANAYEEWLRYKNQGATRNQPLSNELIEALDFLPEMGISMEVFSGGQPAEGSARIGSHRHDHGNAADVFFYKGNKRLDWSNPEDIPVFEEIVRRGRAAGLTGFGAGPGYMQPGSMHLGFGPPAVWGAGGRGANAPEWLQSAFNSKGVTLNSTPVASGTPAPPITASRDVKSYPVAEVAAADVSTPDTKMGFMDAIKQLSDPKTKAGAGMEGMLKALQNTGDRQAEIDREAANITPSGALAAAESADAQRMAAAQQLMATMMANKKKMIPGRVPGLSLMG